MILSPNTYPKLISDDRIGELKSEIRESHINKLTEKVHKNKYQDYLKSMRLTKIRGFRDAEISFDFPVTALIGPNGAGKTTVLGAAGLLYKQVPPPKGSSQKADATMTPCKIGK